MNPDSQAECPVSTTDLKDMYDGLVKHVSCGAKTDFWTVQKLRKDAYTKYLEAAKFRLQNHQLKNTFHLPDVDPLTLSGWMFMNQRDPCEIQIC